MATKIAVITCSPQPDYIRAVVLRRALAALPAVDLKIVKNRRTGLLRYPEIWLKIVGLRLSWRPDIYLLTFRGYETLPFLSIAAWPKPIIFDELINAVEWTVYEHHILSHRSLTSRLFEQFYHLLLKRPTVILADTEAHADYSARLSQIDRATFLVVPVGADENLFKPAPLKKDRSGFNVFYYAQRMAPLHGLEEILVAAEQLSTIADLNFYIVGGDEAAASAVLQAQTNGARIKYKPWLEFKQLIEPIQQADLCLGGPFGSSLQASKIITGKTFQFLACARPTIIGQNEATGIFSDGQNCLMVPLGDAEALADKIKWAYDHQTKLPSIGRAGRQLFEEEFSEAVISKALEGMLKRLEISPLA